MPYREVHGGLAAISKLPRWLFSPSQCVRRCHTFDIQPTLFGQFDLIYFRRSNNGSRRAIRLLAASLTEAALFIYRCSERDIVSGHAVTWSGPSMWANDNRSNSEIHSFLHEMRIIVANIISQTQAKWAVRRFAPPSRFRVLNRPLRSVFMRDARVLDVVFKMEDDGIIFIGDLVQTPEAQLLLYTDDPRISSEILGNLVKRDLCMHMYVQGWSRPSTFGISM